MANTVTSTKRARQALKRQARNTANRSSTKTTLKKAIDALRANNAEQAKNAYMDAVRALAKAASKGAIPKGRASRKISRLTLLAKKTLPEALSSK